MRASARERIQRWSDIDGQTGCWVWALRVDRHGYGHFKMDGRSWLAHRAAYHVFVGAIPSGLTIDHLCRNTRCVNPEHLEPVTNQENCRRGIEATKTHCVNGHLFDQENTYRHGETRHCRKCNAARSQSYKQRKGTQA